MSARLNGVLTLVGLGVTAHLAGVLSAGSHDLVTSHIRNATVEFRYSRRAAPDSELKTGSTQTMSVEELQAPAERGMFRVIHHAGSGGSYFIDTLVFKRDGLVPVWEHLYQASAARNLKSTRMITYHGKTAEVSSQANDSAAHTDTIRFVAPPFGFNQLEQVLQSVPQREGYRTVVALYSEGDNAQELDTISVLGRSSDGKGWRVRFADRVFAGIYVVDGTTRDLVSAESRSQKPSPAVMFGEFKTSSP